MDCLTISTFRNLEQQAIRQYKELKSTEKTYVAISRETFGQEQPYTITHLPFISNQPETTTPTTKGINYYA